MKDYQRERIMVFLNCVREPLGNAYNVIQAKIAIGSGQLLGKGVAGATQSRLSFLPERHTDFIFAVFAEMWGFVGCFLLLACYAVLLSRGFDIAASAPQTVGRLVALGATALLATQILINVGMVTGLLPVVGRSPAAHELRGLVHAHDARRGGTPALGTDAAVPMRRGARPDTRAVGAGQRGAAVGNGSSSTWDSSKPGSRSRRVTSSPSCISSGVDQRSIVGSVYKGTVTNVLPGMQAAFVDIGLARTPSSTPATTPPTSRGGRPCWRGGRRGSGPRCRDRGRRGAPREAAGPIEDMLRSAARPSWSRSPRSRSGTKGARVTSFISHTRPLRRLHAAGPARRRLPAHPGRARAGPPAGGPAQPGPAAGRLIVRTNAEGKGEEEFAHDVEFLGRLWSADPGSLRAAAAAPPRSTRRGT